MSESIKANTPAHTPTRRPAEFTARYRKTPEAAAYLGLSPRTLEKHRCYGTGPAYRKLGGTVVYAIEDIEAWAAIGLRRSTSDPGISTVLPAKRHYMIGSNIAPQADAS
jgi:predicted DNA-binding transcriptional regulator AlpA